MPQSQPTRRSRRAALALLLGGGLVAAVLAPPAAAAPPPGLYGATGVLGNDTAPPSSLYRIDPDTGAATAVGSIGHAVGGLALDPTTRILYGVTTARELTSAERFLIRLDDATGAGTVVGSLGTNHIGDIAFDSAGQLYGWSESRRAGDGFAAVDDLVRIDKATGAVTDVGDSGLNPSWGNGVAFDNSGALFGSLNGDYGWLWRINPANGAIDRGPRLTGSPNRTGGAGVAAATFGCGGTTLYGVVNDFGDPPTHLVTIDPTSGDITNRGVTVTALDALEWVCAAPAGGTPPPPGPRPGRCANPLAGTTRADNIAGSPFGDTIRGGGGNDVIQGRALDDCLYGEAGEDKVWGQLGKDLLDGGDGDDRLWGDSNRDTLRGRAGADVLQGGSGHDRLDGGIGNDRLDGDANADRMYGGPGHDRLIAGGGDDRLAGGDGRDVLSGGPGRNAYAGGPGNDKIRAVNERRETISCGPGVDEVEADRGDRVARDCERVARARTIRR